MGLKPPSPEVRNAVLLLVVHKVTYFFHFSLSSVSIHIYILLSRQNDNSLKYSQIRTHVFMCVILTILLIGLFGLDRC